MKMKQSSSSPVTSFLQHGSVFLLVQLILIAAVSAQPPGTPPPTNEQYPYARFTPSMAIIIVVLIAALFFMGFFSIYIRHCSDSPSAAGSIRRALSMRARRAAAARGLDASVIETFPTFTYSEVKGKRIGKGALECAVCINEFEDDETLRLIPKCDHAFHPECIDTWLESHVTCPVCRANLSPEQPGDEVAVNAPPEASTGDAAEERTGDEIVVQVDDDNDNNGESNPPNQGAPPRAWSVRRPKVFGFGKFRSHSTGHSVVQPWENLDRFTLKLPAQVRKEVMDRAALNRTSSCAVRLPREGSSRRGPRLGGEGSSRAGRYLRMERSDRQTKSDRWVFFTRGLSMRSPKVVATGAEKGEGSTSKEGESRAPVRMPSLKCLEPKADGDEVRLVSGDSGDSAARPHV